MPTVPPLAAGGAVWDVTAFNIRVPDSNARRVAAPHGSAPHSSGAETGAVCCCEVEVLERKRQFYRSFVLHYHTDWFQVWEHDETDYRAVADHARRWISIFLTFHREPANLSGCQRSYVARIYW